MNILRTQLVSWSILGCLFVWGSNFLIGQEYKSGALILVSKSGDVSFEKLTGEKAPLVGVGNPIPPSYTIITGSDGELVGLLSNGTLLTLTEGTRMKVKTFEQEPFMDGGEKLRDLPGEPSRSKVEIDLDIGSLVVKTKKLNKGSVFDINSPVGVAGIRGTEFQMASMPGKGVQLDVTESTVAFTPPGGGAPIAVSQGSGLTVPPSGVPQMRPVNPIAAQKIEKTNEAATTATQNVSLGEVSAAMEQVETESESTASEEQSTEEAVEDTVEEPEDSDEVNTEENPSEEIPDDDSEPNEEIETLEEGNSIDEPESMEDSEASNQPSDSLEEQVVSEGSSEELGSDDISPDFTENLSDSENDSLSVEGPNEVDLVSNDEGGVPQQDLTMGQEQSESLSSNQAAPSSANNPPVNDAPQSPANTAPEPNKPKALKSPAVSSVSTQDKSQMMESNPEFKKRQETAKFDLDDAQVEQYGQLDEGIQKFIREEDEQIVERLFSGNDFSKGRVEDFYGYSENTRELILDLEDEVMFTLLDGGFEEELLNHGLSIGLSGSQINDYAQLPKGSQDLIREENEVVVKRLFSEDQFTSSRVEEFYNYSEVTRDLILGLEDGVMFSLLDEPYSEEVLNHGLRVGLSKDQLNHYSELNAQTQQEVFVENDDVIRRLFTESEFKDSRVENFYGYTKDTRDLILSLEDEVMFALLDEEFEEELLQESLTVMNLDFSNSVNIPSNQPSDPLAVRVNELSDRLKESGNGWVMNELLEMSGGQLTDEWIRIGEVAEVLLRNHLVDDLNPADVFQTSEVRINPFYVEVSSLFDELELEALVIGSGVMIGANDLIIPENSQALNPYFRDGVEEVVLSASQSISFEGGINWEAPVGTNEARLVVMSGGELNLKEGMTLESATSDLILSTREDLVLRQVNLNAAREVVIRGLRDVSLEDVSIRASNLAKIKARRNLDVNGLSFRQDISKIVMEATTLRLRNVDFPRAAQVRLNSLKGGLDGRYPNFGKVSAAQQVGRVNFIENVKSGGNLLNNRASFDQHGKNIQIGKIATP